MPSQQVKGAIEYALAFATAGAGASFSIKTFVPLPVIDAVPQTLIVQAMSHQITSLYGLTSIRGLATFTTMIIGVGSGAKLISEVASFIPVAGPSTSAATSFALHMSTGIVLIILFELLQEGFINEDYFHNTSTNEISHLLLLATEVLADVVRGNNGVESVGLAVEKFKVQSMA